MGDDGGLDPDGSGGSGEVVRLWLDFKDRTLMNVEQKKERDKDDHPGI